MTNMLEATGFSPDGPVTSPEGEFTYVELIDPAKPGNGARVFNPNQPIEIAMEWELHNAALWLANSATGTWDIEVFAESIGPGPELRIAAGSVPVGNPTDTSWSFTATVTPGTLVEGNPGSGNPSGVYKLVLTAFLNGNVNGFDVCGFAEGPVFKVEDPF